MAYNGTMPSSEYPLASFASAGTSGDSAGGGGATAVPLWNHVAKSWEQHTLEEVERRFRASVDVRDRTYHFKTYRKCFVGAHAVTALYSGGVAFSRGDAVRLGSLLLECGGIEHCLREHTFKDEFLFYRFVTDAERGCALVKGDRASSWAAFLVDADARSAHPRVDVRQLPDGVAHVARRFAPMDACNVRLLDNVHPPEWVDPRYTGTYHLVVVGGGAAGLEAAASAARIGAKVALVEACALGGTSRNTGCHPSKALRRVANAVHRLRSAHAAHCGVQLGEVRVDFAQVMRKVRERRAAGSERCSARRYTRKVGADVFYGYAKFHSDRALLVAGKTIDFRRAVVCTGAYPSIPPIPGLRELHGMQNAPDGEQAPELMQAMVMTTDNLFNMTTLPKRLCVLGSGVIAMELAQAMQRLGSAVTIFGRADSVLPSEERDLVAEVVRQMERDGVRFRLHVTNYDGIKPTGRVGDDGRRELLMQTQERNGTKSYRFDAILVASGRKPNVSGLDLEAAGVDYDTRYGVQVSDVLQTSNTRIFAVGDCCSAYKTTHAAQHMARIAVRNALLMRRERASDLAVPFVAHTAPELARVGPTFVQLVEDARTVDTVEVPFARNVRARCEGDAVGLLRLYVERSTGALLGAAVLGTGATDVINELMVAMAADVKLDGLAKVIHVFPTRTEVVREVGLQRLTGITWAKKFRSSRKQSITA